MYDTRGGCLRSTDVKRNNREAGIQASQILAVIRSQKPEDWAGNNHVTSERASDAVIAVALREDGSSLGCQYKELEKRTGLVLLAKIQSVVLRKVRRQSPNSVHPMASTVWDWRHLGKLYDQKGNK